MIRAHKWKVGDPCVVVSITSEKTCTVERVGTKYVWAGGRRFLKDGSHADGWGNWELLTPADYERMKLEKEARSELRRLGVGVARSCDINPADILTALRPLIDAERRSR